VHKQKDALKILGCSKMTLSRYVNDGSLSITKKGRNTYYDEHEVAALVFKIEANQKKVGIEVKPKEKIDLPQDARQDFESLSANNELDAIGMFALKTATQDLTALGLYEECDKQILLLYALNNQAYNRYFVLAMKEDCMASSASGALSVHPYHKAMQYHEKQMLQCMDRLGMSPLARQKLSPKDDPKDIDPMEALLAK
jgi:P27 family predicted phage terminase small subunit